MRQPKSARVSANLQGDGRPFSLARQKPAAIVPRKLIAPLIGPLGLSLTDGLCLQNGIVAILQDYLGELRATDLQADHAEAMKALGLIAKQSARLAEQITRLPNEYLVRLEEHRRDPEVPADPPKFDFLQLDRTLGRLSRAAERTRDSMGPRRRGRPPQSGLDEAIGRFRALFEKFNLIVHARESGSKQVRRSLKGSGGALLVQLFKEFDPYTHEAQLWGAWQRTALAAPGG